MIITTGSEGEPKSPAHLPQDKLKLQGNGKKAHAQSYPDKPIRILFIKYTYIKIY